MGIKAIFMDMDGTLLQSDKETISEQLINKLNELESRGVKIFIATGRSYSAAERFVKKIGIKNPVITYNGGKIINPINNEIIFENPVSTQNIKKLIEFSHEYGVHLNLYYDEKLYIEKETDEGLAYIRKTKMDYIVENFNTFVETGKVSTKCLFLAEHNKLLKMKEKLEKEIEELIFVFSQDTYLECLNRDVNKGIAVKKMMEKYNFEPNEVIAFGDQWNDYEMLTAVGKGYLMGNANDDIKSKFSKDRITKSNDEDGIFEVIKDL